MPIIEKKVTTIEYSHGCGVGPTKLVNPNVIFNKSYHHWRFFTKPVAHCPDCGEKLEIPPKPERKQGQKRT